MIFLVCVASSVITPARPTSLPVPAVVGMAMIGAMRVGARPLPPVADILEIPERAGLAGHERDHLAAVQRTAAAQRHHAVMARAMEGAHAGLDIGRRPGWSARR